MFRNKIKIFKNIVVVLALSASTAFSTPIDWNGAIGFDNTLIDTFRKIKSTNYVAGQSVGSQEAPLAQGNHANASFQSYIFRLNPVLIVNDSASIFAEITTGHGRGGHLGDSSIQSKDASFGNSLYLLNTSDTSKNALSLTKLNMVLYSDTLTYIIGRHSKHWALGAVVNSGENLWDRHTSVRDGITMKLKISSFEISPFWAKISSEDSLTGATKAKEYGLSALYDNTEKDMTFGVFYSKKQNDFDNQSIKTNINNTTTSYSFGKTDIKFLDLYFKKTFGAFKLALEFPLISGDIGDIYQTSKAVKFKSKALIFETSYQLTDSWDLGLNLGHIDGDSGSGSSFEAMFLHPNYQVANLMFRYNMLAISDPVNKNLYDSYMTNARYLKFFGKYVFKKWSFIGAFIYAKANETAKNGLQAYNHTTNKIFNASADQSSDLGYEIDFNMNYQWNSEVKIGTALGYHFVGDYFAFTDSAIKNSTNNSFMGQISVGMEF